MTNPDSVAAGDRYTTPVYVSITKDNKIVWPTDGKALKLDPNDKENFRVDFPEVVTAMKKGDSLRIVVEMDDECTGWMNRVWCDPVVYNVGAYDAAKDLNPNGSEEKKDEEDQDRDDNGSIGGDNSGDATIGGNTDDADKPVKGDETPESPATGHGFPVALAVLGAMSAAAVVFTKKQK
ncbi:MAG: hypothetical protein IIW40_01265 [Clostridia bacterium]|nr:hypothetical protein [Clostridia bacterium]